MAFVELGIFIFQAIIIVFTVSQIVIPLLRNRPLFPAFRKHTLHGDPDARLRHLEDRKKRLEAEIQLEEHIVNLEERHDKVFAKKRKRILDGVTDTLGDNLNLDATTLEQPEETPEQPTFEPAKPPVRLKN